MARLNTIIDSDDEFPELSSILARIAIPTQQQQPSPSSLTHPSKRSSCSSDCGNSQERIQPLSSDDTKKAIPLRIAHVDSLLLSFVNKSTLTSEKGLPSHNDIKSSPRRAVRCPPKRQNFVPASSDSSESDNSCSDHLSDFIVPDSDSDESFEDCPRHLSTSDPNFKSRRKNDSAPYRSSPTHRARHRYEDNSLDSPRKEPLAVRGHQSTRRRPVPNVEDGSWVDLNQNEEIFKEPNSILKFSPPRLKSPSRSPPVNGMITPPSSPSKSKLLSPTKRVRIPPSPHRPSIDAFWSQEVINDWNDQHSPRKTPKSTYSRKLYPLDEDDEAYLSPCETGRRLPSKSPSKRSKEVANERKAFNQKKYTLAASFLEELDRTITNGQIAALSESTGGVRLVWSKKLQSTAGRANWKREAIRTKNADGTISTTEYRHHAFIELAEKVIDDEDRLINVIAHEYCHLLNFMISNVKNNPHGKEFKRWARECSTAFAHRGVNVTTKHTYEITYKYIWVCTDCGTEYKRHSKSIDPTKHACGKCKEKLVQVKPAPRGEGKRVGEYQKYVKEHFARVKMEKPEMGMGEVMAVLGREFRELKGKREEGVVVMQKEMADEDPEDDKDAGIDSVVRELDFLSLGTG